MLRKKIPISCHIICEKTTTLFKIHGKNYFFDDLNCFEFPSKKNYVIKTNVTSTSSNKESFDSISVVIKYFNPERKDHLNAWQNEKIFIERSRILFPEGSIPPILDCIPGIILYPYYEGLTYKDLLLNESLSPNALAQLAGWFFKLHQNGYSFGDPRLQNFFYKKDDHLIVFDYEEVKMKSPSKDLFELLSAFIDLEPNYKITHDRYSVQKMVEFFTLYQQMFNETESNQKSEQRFSNRIVDQIIIALRKTLKRRNQKLNKPHWHQIASELHIAFNF